MQLARLQSKKTNGLSAACPVNSTYIRILQKYGFFKICRLQNSAIILRTGVCFVTVQKLAYISALFKEALKS
jgi:hypothetical protein